jgi:hypothetical protein
LACAAEADAKWLSDIATLGAGRDSRRSSSGPEPLVVILLCRPPDGDGASLSGGVAFSRTALAGLLPAPTITRGQGYRPCIDATRSVDEQYDVLARARPSRD